MRADPNGQPNGRIAVFHEDFRDDLRYWVETDRKMAIKIIGLVESVMRDPFSGVGKPEPLKHEHSGAWSRRITQEHRMVYIVESDRIIFMQARGHY